MEIDLLAQLQGSIREMRSCGMTWEAIGIQYNINRAMARLLGNGYVPGKKVRKVLGLPNVAAIIVIGSGEIPDGTQAITARRCSCGQWYIPNSGNRTHCFLCRPFARGGRRIS